MGEDLTLSTSYPKFYAETSGNVRPNCGGFNFGVGTKLLRGETKIDLKLNGGLYTDGSSKVAAYAGIGRDHHEYNYRPFVFKQGFEVRNLVNITTQETTRNIEKVGITEKYIQERKVREKNFQLNLKPELEYETQNGKFTANIGFTAGTNIAYGENQKKTKIEENNEKKKIEVTEKKPPTMNLAINGGAAYRFNNHVALNLTGELGNTNKEIGIGMRYTF